MGKRVIVILLLLLVLVSFAHGAKIRGAIYDHNLDPISKSVVFINTSPEQTRVSQYGGYHFVVEPGSYEIYAELTRNGITKEIAREYITISTEGDFTKDLFLYDDFDMASEFDDTFWTVSGRYFNENYGVIVGIGSIIAVILLVIFGYIAVSRKRQVISPVVVNSAEMVEPEPVKKKEVLSDDERIKQKITFILKKEKKMTQKDIRKKFSFSEAKMSLILSQMESEGQLERKKSGRVNVIVLRQ